MSERDKRAEEAEAKLARLSEPGPLEPLEPSMLEVAWEYLVRDWPVSTDSGERFVEALETMMVGLDALGADGWEVAVATPFASPRGSPWMRVIFKRPNVGVVREE